jgi:hypothetical protein
MNFLPRDELIRSQLAITLFLVVLAVLACAFVYGFFPRLSRKPAARLVVVVTVFHLFLGPWGVCILAYESRHPELWGDPCRNPHLVVPFCVCMEVVIVAVLWRHGRKEWRMAEGNRLLEKALRLLAEGKQDAADAAYRKGLRLTGLEQEFLPRAERRGGAGRSRGRRPGA